MILNFDVQNQKLALSDKPYIATDSREYLTAQFVFSDDWSGTEKTAIFKGAIGTYCKVLTGDSCTVPSEVLYGNFSVSVFGTLSNMRITTNSICINAIKSGYTPGETPSEPTPSVYEQIMDKIADEEMTRKTMDDTLSERLMAEETARTAADKALTDTINGKADKTALEAETAAREADIAAIKDGTDIDSFADVETALTGKQDVGDYATVEDLAKKQDKLTFDTDPTIGSNNPVTSDGVMRTIVSEILGLDDRYITVYELANKQDKLTFDSLPTADSVNPVTSGGVEAALAKKADKEAVPKKVSDLTDDLNLAKTDGNNNFTTSQTITGTLTVNGDIVQNGASYESHAEQLYTKNDLIKTRDGAVGGLGDGEYTGIEAEKYDGENNGRLVFDANGTARVGDVGNEQPLLTRKEATELEDYELFRWNADTQRATGVHIGFGLAIATNKETGKENLMVWGATETQINQRAGNYLPITVGTLDYAVRSVLPKTADTIPSTLIANTEYYAGELATVSFALPTTGKLGQYCFVKFDSGATATTLSVTGSYAGDIPTPIANKTYEIIATWNGSKWVCSYRGY